MLLVLGRVVRKCQCLSDEGTFEERHSKEVRKQMRDIWGKSSAGRRYSKCKNLRRSMHDFITE